MTNNNNVIPLFPQDPNKTSEMYNPNTSMTSVAFTKTGEPSTLFNQEWYNIIKTCINTEVNDIMKLNSEESVIKMDAYLEKYIDKIDKEQTEFRQEMRERDSRTEQRQGNLENRLAKLNEDSEKRTQENMKKIEEALLRMENKISESEKNINEDFKKLEHNISTMTKDHRSFGIATIVALAGIIIASFVGIAQIVSAIPK